MPNFIANINQKKILTYFGRVLAYRNVKINIFSTLCILLHALTYDLTQNNVSI
jgi:hypothetical protein